MIIKSCMKRRLISIPSTATIGDAAATVCKERVGTIPVVDKDGILVGVVRLRDLQALVMPDFIRLVEDFDFVHDFGAIESRQPSAKELSQSVTDIMVEPIAVEETSGLLRAAAMMYRQGVADMLVVSDDGKLVGIASRVDIGVALLSSWKVTSGSE